MTIYTWAIVLTILIGVRILIATITPRSTSKEVRNTRAGAVEEVIGLGSIIYPELLVYTTKEWGNDIFSIENFPPDSDCGNDSYIVRIREKPRGELVAEIRITLNNNLTPHIYTIMYELGGVGWPTIRGYFGDAKGVGIMLRDMKENLWQYAEEDLCA